MKNISLNFGSIKDTIQRISSNKMINEGFSKQFIELFVNEIKEKPVLNVQYLIYKNIEKASFSKEYLAERFLNQNINLISEFKFNDILKENKDLRVKVLNNIHVEANSKNEELFESIHTLIKAKTSPNFQEFDEENKAYEFVIDYLTNNNKNSVNENLENEEKIEFPKFLSWKYVTELAINNFNERYSHLNESEQKLVKILMSDSNYKRNYLEDLKQENLNLINAILDQNNDSDVVSNLNKFKNKIETLKENNIDDSIINLYELNLTLKD